MANSGPTVPIQILDDVIKNTKGFADPGGSNALMHYSQMYPNNMFAKDDKRRLYWLIDQYLSNKITERVFWMMDKKDF